jgi:hypothetical protein
MPIELSPVPTLAGLKSPKHFRRGDLVFPQGVFVDQSLR